MKTSTQVRVLDQDGRHAYVAEPEHAAWLIRCGYGTGLGTKQAIRCVRLTVPLALLAGAEVVGRASTASDLSVRFTEREMFAGRPVFKHKGYLSKAWNRACCRAVLRSVLAASMGPRKQYTADKRVSDLERLERQQLALHRAEDHAEVKGIPARCVFAEA